MTTATAITHDYALTRTNGRTAAEYSVWVNVDDYTPADQGDLYSAPERAYVEATGWSTLGHVVVLTDDELAEILESVEDDHDDFAGY